MFCRILWILFSLIEKVYWYVKRNVQKQRFSSCGNHVFISRYCAFLGDIEIGDDVYIGQYCRFQSTSAKIKIGSHIMFGPNVSIHGGNHRTDIIGRYMKSVTVEEKRATDDMDVIIEDDVWLGANSIVLKGVRIGEGSVIGAGCVVSKNVPPYTIVTGNMERRERERWSEADIEKHKKIIKK